MVAGRRRKARSFFAVDRRGSGGRAGGDRTVVEWDKFTAEYDLIRDAIEAVFPIFQGYNARIREPGGFHRQLEALAILGGLDRLERGPDQPHAQAGGVHRMGMLDKRFTVPVESPHLHLKIDFHTWFSAPARVER